MAEHPIHVFLRVLIRWIVPVAVPLFLLLMSVRVVMTEPYLRLEYQRAGFPADRYGWDTDVRLTYGPYGVRYLLNDADISYLGDLVIEGEPAFTSRELDHMEDVKVVTRAAMQILAVAALLLGLAVVYAAWQPDARRTLLLAISRGGWNMLGVGGGLLLLALISWDFFFDGFHALFFEDGTWQFYRSDTLIRLYPPQFWFDSAIVVGILTIAGAAACAIVPRWWLRKNKVS